jgi:hypothetical protein
METIEITLKNVKLRNYHLISRIFAFINIITLLFLAAIAFEKHRTLLIFMLSAALLFLIAEMITRFNPVNKKKLAAPVYILAAVVWIKWELYPIAALVVFFYLLYYFSTRKFEVFISADHIIYPSFPKRSIRWSELENIILKDGILTIDFKNNKLIQNEIEGNDRIDEKKINSFCREYLNK